MANNSWEKCPKCEGSGKEFNNGAITGIPLMDMMTTAHNGLIKMYEIKGMKNICPVCEGKMIISSLNGNPPIIDSQNLTI